MRRAPGFRAALAGLVLCAAFALAHSLLLRAASHGHAAHALLGAGHATPPLAAAALATSLVAVRFVAVVVAPGLALACAVVLAAARFRPHSAGTSSGAGISVGDSTGTSIGRRGTV